MRKKAIGFLGGQFGDAITTIAAQKIFCEDFPDYDFTFALSEKYAGIMPLFEHQPHIKTRHLWQGYDGLWPTEKDKTFLKDSHYDIVFNPMQGVGDGNWMNRIHQVELCCERYGLRRPQTPKVSLHRFFEKNESYKGCVAVSLFPNGGDGLKNLGAGKVQEVCDFLIKLGHKVIQIGGAMEPDIQGAHKLNLSYFESVKVMCSCDFLVTGDTGMSWVASAYDIPVVGCYAYGYHSGAASSKNWQPINPRAIYLERYDAKDIPIQEILESVLRVRQLEK